MTDQSSPGLSIRDGIAWNPDFGYVVVCDPATEERKPHARLRAWHQGRITESWAKFNAHSLCRTTLPERAIVLLSEDGFYGTFSSQVHAGNIFDESQPQPTEPRYGSFSAVAQIDGMAYAVGLRGMVYRLDRPASWTRIDEKLARDFDAEAIDGFSASDLYVAGLHGELWQSDGQSWVRRESSTNVNLNSVKCAGDGVVYIGGDAGMLIRGRNDVWEILDQQEMRSDIWDIEWFEGKLYVSTFSGVYWLAGSQLQPVDFGSDPPKTFYHLSTGEGVLWSVGEYDVMSFDGKAWTRIDWQIP